MFSIKFLISIVIGFCIAKFFAGKKAGQSGRLKSIKFSVNKFIIHIHHWILGVITIAFLLYYELGNEYVYGLLVGIILQGLTYKDFYKVCYRKL